MQPHNCSEMSRRDFLKAAAVVLGTGTLGGLAAACGPAPTTVPPTAPPAAVPTVVSAPAFDWKRFAGTQISYLAKNQRYTTEPLKYLSEFEQLTGIKVTPDLATSQEFYQKQTLALTTAPEKIDLLDYTTEVMRWRMVGGGFLEDLNPFLNDKSLTATDYDFSDFIEAQVKNCSSKDGKQLWGIPYEIPAPVFAYRKDVYDAKGLKVPQTLDEFEKNIAACHDPTKEFYGWTTRGVAVPSTHTFAFVRRALGAPYLDKNNKASVNSPEMIQALEYYGRLLRNYGPPGPEGLDDAKCVALFSQGRAAHTYLSNTYHYAFWDPSSSKVVGQIGWFTAPKGPKGGGDSAGPIAISICSKSKNKQAAWYFAQWFTNKRNQLRSQVLPEPTGRKSAWAAPEFKQGLKGDAVAFMTTMEAALANGFMDAHPPAEDFSGARATVGAAITVAIQGGDIKAAAEKANIAYQKQIDSEGGVPPIY